MSAEIKQETSLGCISSITNVPPAPLFDSEQYQTVFLGLVSTAQQTLTLRRAPSTTNKPTGRIPQIHHFVIPTRMSGPKSSRLAGSVGVPLATRPLAVNDARDDVAGSGACLARTRAEANNMTEGKLLPAGSPGTTAVLACAPGAVASLNLAGPLTAHGAARNPALQAAAAALRAWARLLPDLGGPAPGTVAGRAEAGSSGRHGGGG